MMNIGNYILLRNAIDPNFRITRHIRSSLGVVDLIPVDYTLKLANIGKGDWAIEYTFDDAIEVFQRICQNYGLMRSRTYSGLRMWLTDETQAQESIQHSFDANVIEEKINSLSGHGRALRGLAKAFGTSVTSHGLYSKLQSFVTDTVAEGAKKVTGMVSDDEQLAALVTQSVKTAGEVIFQGKQVSLPRIWKGSTYNPTLSVSVKLVSPYGSPAAIKYYIIEPLLYILILTSPRSNDGLSYGLFQPVRVKAYGMANINVGAVTNITIIRGGRETAYNVFKQPLSVEVRLDIDPLADGFAVMDGTDNESYLEDIATFEDAGTEYEDVGTSAPAFTTLGNVIQSLRPAPNEVTVLDAGGYLSTVTSSSEESSTSSNYSTSSSTAVANGVENATSETTYA